MCKHDVIHKTMLTGGEVQALLTPTLLLNLIYDPDFQSSASCGPDPYTGKKLSSKVLLVQNQQWKQADGRTDGHHRLHYLAH